MSIDRRIRFNLHFQGKIFLFPERMYLKTQPPIQKLPPNRVPTESLVHQGKPFSTNVEDRKRTDINTK